MDKLYDFFLLKLYTLYFVRVCLIFTTDITLEIHVCFSSKRLIKNTDEKVLYLRVIVVVYINNDFFSPLLALK